MRARATCVVAFGLVGLLSGNTTQALAADDLSKKNNLSVTRPSLPRFPDDVYSRMFPGLPSFAPQTDESREQAKTLGGIDGILDAKDKLTEGPIRLITEQELSENNPNNPNMTAGVTFFGQFLDHDLTLALKAPLDERTEPRRTTNFRTAEFDLDSVYGNGPAGSPELYDTSSGDITQKSVI